MNNKRYKKAKLEGKCVGCGTKKPEEGKIRCSVCLQKQRDNHIKKYKMNEQKVIENFEYEITDDNSGDFKINDIKEGGYKVYKTEVKIIEERTLFSKRQKTIKVYHWRRNITPIKLKINTTIEVPKHVIDTKKVGGFNILGKINGYFRERGLLK